MNEEYVFQENLGRSAMRELYDWVEAGMMAVVLVVVLFTFVARTAGVDGESMLPTLEHKDRLFISRMLYTPTPGDIVVVTKPNRHNEPLIKRIIAVEGQEVSMDFQRGVVSVDGVELYEPYTNSLTNISYDVDFSQGVRVPEGCVFIMGDNRNHSWDSRDSEVGMVDERYILGKVIYRVLPYGKMGVPE